MKITLINDDCLKHYIKADTVFGDPPDNIGLGYNGYKDKLPKDKYIKFLNRCLEQFIVMAKTTWFSFNAKWIPDINYERLSDLDVDVRLMVQTFTFGQNRQTDLGNGFRPLLRVRDKDAPLYPNRIRVKSWRQENGDKRADPRGCVPLDEFNFPRVTGNSKQRRKWHPTQLHEDLVERCLKLTTPKNGHVLDPFGGTGTTLRVCKKLDFNCTLIELDTFYCEKIAEEHGLKKQRDGVWTN